MPPKPNGYLVFFQRWLVNTLAVLTASLVVKGIDYDNWQGLVIASLLLGILNAIVRPLIMVLSLPFLILSLGLFTLVINAALLYFVGWAVNSFHVDSFSAAFWGGLVISFVSTAVQWLTGTNTTSARVQVNTAATTTITRRPPKGPGDGGNGPVIDV
ncbi:hypothetical protein LBMAG56_15700 [Verrucomicrobiota bacterium]|nr:hypothetical protein LBMAG56_15700 [Verrucomicrobiota bacterium]